MSLTFAAASLIAMTLGAAAPPDAGSSTALELAIAERACGLAAYSSVTESETNNACVRDQVAALRADFGRDLSGLSARDRKSLDAACSHLNTPLGREGYLDCLNTQLATLRNRRNKSGRTAEVTAPQASPPTAPDVAAERHHEPGASPLLLTALGTLAAAAVAGVGLLIVRKRRAPHSAASAASA